MAKVSVADRWVHSSEDNWGTRKGPALGFVLHMAEGTNVSRYLSGNNVKRNVSVHFTVEQNGEIHQMLNLNRISGSINPNDIRTTNDKSGRYGAKHAKYALKDWWKNPNNAVITVEVAGRQAEGPNSKQVAAIEKLFRYLIKRYPKLIPLGHRDFQDVKPCPGAKFYYRVFKEIGGHGTEFRKSNLEQPTPEPPKPSTPDSGQPSPTGTGDQMIIGQGLDRKSKHVVALPVGTAVYERTTDTKPLFKTTVAGDYEYFGYTRDPKDWWAIEVKAPASVFPDGKSRPVIAYIKESGLLSVREKPASTVPPVVPDAELVELRAKVEKYRELVTEVGVAVGNADALVDQLEQV